MSTIRVENLKRYYGKLLASSIDELTINEGEFFTLLGPSGCGKTTTLRMLSGLLPPSQGKIFMDNKDITDLPPEKRDITMVFQNFALFPHMNVFENVAFGLRMMHLPENEIEKRVYDALKMMRIDSLAKRKVDQISGGQQQRVGVARAIAPRPGVVLFDEALSNLDAKLREEVRYELHDLQKSLKITSVFVTHDQAEAMVLSDRIALMNAGRIIQIGTPDEIYSTPINAFVAAFIGLANFVEGHVEKQMSDDKWVFKTEDGLEILARKGTLREGDVPVLLVRPEDIRIGRDLKGENVFKGVIESRIYLGGQMDYRIKLGNHSLRTFIQSTQAVGEAGEEIPVQILSDHVIIIRKD
jgi:iron(III) transport system ATP-binding protein